MTFRVTWNGKQSGISIDWSELVLMPAQQGYFMQAFASADSILDDTAEAILRQKFNSHESQTLINRIHEVRGRANFDGSVIFLLLHKMKIIDQALYERITKFKTARQCSHTPQHQHGKLERHECPVCGIELED